ncbi:hypothetical protein ACFWA9_22665 [Kitasatospora sp. NPDC059973]|uniref:hypothetical protein n=1 Tax=Kitasatospora sp. NPDC059973 TaxID=3347020 RepID=UPI0036B8FB09
MLLIHFDGIPDQITFPCSVFLDRLGVLTVLPMSWHSAAPLAPWAGLPAGARLGPPWRGRAD